MSLFTNVASTAQPQDPIWSKRKNILDFLASQGCNNKVLAHYIVDAARTNVPATAVFQRLNGVIPTTVLQSDVTKWVNLAISFIKTGKANY